MIIRPPTLDWSTFQISDVPANPEPFRLANRIPIRDNGEPLVDLRETNPELSFGTYCLPYVRESVAEALKIASRNTPDHLELWVHTALRTLEQQAEMYWHNYNRAKEEHPEWPESVLRKMTNRFFAPPDVKAPPGHCTGGAVDVGLTVRETGEGLDVRSPLTGWDSAPTAVHGLSEEAAENRRLLCFLMHSSGLSNCRDEFWHWSYGDSAWAVRVGADVAPYGLVEPPEGATRVVGPRIKTDPYDPAYVDHFEELKAALEGSLGALAHEIVHIGSSSVPGLTGRPILDLGLVAPDDETLAKAAEILCDLGYVRQGDEFRAEARDVPKVDALRKWPAHVVHACLDGSRVLRRHVALRDHLRMDPDSAGKYADLKRELARKHTWDGTRYDEAKSRLLRAILTQVDPSLADPSWDK